MERELCIKNSKREIAYLGKSSDVSLEKQKNLIFL